MLIRFSIIVLFMSVISCTTTPVNKPISLWNSTQYFDQEIQELKQNKTAIRKVLTFNEKTNSITSLMVEWEKELSVFTLIDLSNSKNNGRYHLDTLINTDTLCIIVYQAIEAKTTLQSCTISTNPKTNKIVCIEAQYEDVTNLYTSEKSLTYYPKQGFNVAGSQHVKLGAKTNYNISGTFIKH